VVIEPEKIRQRLRDCRAIVHHEQLVRERPSSFLQSEKLATMGSLLAGVAHGAEQPLAVVMGAGRTVLPKWPTTTPPPAGEKIGSAAERWRAIVQNFLASPPAPTRAGRRVAQRGGPGGGRGCSLRTADWTTSRSSSIWPATSRCFWADAHQLHQSIVNLVATRTSNAAHAAPRRIRLTTRRDRAGPASQLEIADTGPAFPTTFRRGSSSVFYETLDEYFSAGRTEGGLRDPETALTGRTV